MEQYIKWGQFKCCIVGCHFGSRIAEKSISKPIEVDAIEIEEENNNVEAQINRTFSRFHQEYERRPVPPIPPIPTISPDYTVNVRKAPHCKKCKRPMTGNHHREYFDFMGTTQYSLVCNKL
jgi:hypothetical protein